MHPPVTRFAPSPSGLLHAGHAYSALRAWAFAREAGGRFLLRIEDIDQSRCRREYEDAILEDLAWLGIEWDDPPRRQSDHLADYRETEQRLAGMGLLYPCFCTRKEILSEIERAGGAPHGSEGPLYPGTCRNLSEDERRHRLVRGDAHALRLDLGKALRRVDRLTHGNPLTWLDLEAGPQTARPELLGDAVLVRKDIRTSYHLAAVTDDQFQSVTHIVRGEDLFEATHLHRLLQALLGFRAPRYLHHGLIRDEKGERLAKRNRATTIRAAREAGQSPREYRASIGIEPA